MDTMDIILLVITATLSLVAFVGGWLQWHEKGTLLNNAYFYASKKQRESMDKKPYYRQSAIVLFFVAFIFLLDAIEVIVKCDWFFRASMLFAAIVIIYAVVSSINIEKQGYHR